MDPNLFHLDWDRTSEVLVTVVLLSLIVERSLSVLFESRWFIDKLDEKNLKEVIGLAVSFLICAVWKFDAVSMIVLADQTNWFGYLVTAGIIAGGSKGSIKLFQEWLGFKSSARKEKEERKEDEKKARQAQAPAAPAAPSVATAPAGK